MIQPQTRPSTIVPKTAIPLPPKWQTFEGKDAAPIADDHSFGIVVRMAGKADIWARIVAICYTLVIGAMAWFTFAFFGFELGGDVGGSIAFALIVLSPIPVCILCFRRD